MSAATQFSAQASFAGDGRLRCTVLNSRLASSGASSQSTVPALGIRISRQQRHGRASQLHSGSDMFKNARRIQAAVLEQVIKLQGRV